MVANKDSAHSATHLLESGIKAAPALTKSAVMYGPNAGGKSNLVNALAFMRAVVATSATQMREGQTFNCVPFRLDAEFAERPSEFEITFVEAGIRYQYGFALTPQRVVEEWLLVYKTAKPQQWFTRRYDAKTGEEHYEFGSNLTGQRKLWMDSTRSNALFLSTAVQLNSENLRPIYLWIAEKLVIVGAGLQPVFDFSVRHAQSDEGKQQILSFLNAADLGIADLTFEKRKLKHLGVHLEDGKAPVQTMTEVETPIALFHHRTDKGSANFELPDESLGTQRLFAFAGPVMDVLQNGRVLVVDELDSSLHTLLVRFLIRLFHNPDINKNAAQLVFTTHDTSLLDSDLFRRDQIWFVEKDKTQATRLYPLTDFSPRKNEALERGYLMGRYGALPFFMDLKI